VGGGGGAPLAFDFAFPVAMADTDDKNIFSFYMGFVR
jgi:outer membrane protein insertion porin family